MAVDAVAVCGEELESVTVTEKLDVAMAVGVPETMPVEGERKRPAGSCPEETDHVYGAVPPEALTEPL